MVVISEAMAYNVNNCAVLSIKHFLSCIDNHIRFKFDLTENVYIFVAKSLTTVHMEIHNKRGIG